MEKEDSDSEKNELKPQEQHPTPIYDNLWWRDPDIYFSINGDEPAVYREDE